MTRLKHSTALWRICYPRRKYLDQASNAKLSQSHTRVSRKFFPCLNKTDMSLCVFVWHPNGTWPVKCTFGKINDTEFVCAVSEMFYLTYFPLKLRRTELLTSCMLPRIKARACIRLTGSFMSGWEACRSTVAKQYFPWILIVLSSTLTCANTPKHWS